MTADLPSPSVEGGEPTRNDFVRASEERIAAARGMGEGFLATAIRVELLTMWDLGARSRGSLYRGDAIAHPGEQEERSE